MQSSGKSCGKDPQILLANYCDGTQGFSCWMSNCNSDFFIFQKHIFMSGYIFKIESCLVSLVNEMQACSHLSRDFWCTWSSDYGRLWHECLGNQRQCPEYIILMVCNRTKGQVFPGTQITYSWFLRLENSLSFAKFTFWADAQFNRIAASRLSLLWVVLNKGERQSELCWPWHAITPAQLGWNQQGTPKIYHCSIIFVSSNQRVTLRVVFEESTASTRNERRKQIDLVIDSQDAFLFPINTNWQKMSVNWTEQWLLLK